MNNKPKYEQLIAVKVQEISVPDMKDSIWAAVENELNNISPPDTDEKTPPPGGDAPSFPSFWFYLTTGIIFISVAVLLLVNKKKNHDTLFRKPDDDSTTLDKGKQDSAEINIPAQGIIITTEKYKHKKLNLPDSGTIFIPANRKTDSNDLRHTNQLIADSVKTDPTPNPPINGNFSDTTRKQNILPKPKGVKGINDDDYKIRTYKKDSSKT